MDPSLLTSLLARSLYDALLAIGRRARNRIQATSSHEAIQADLLDAMRPGVERILEVLTPRISTILPGYLGSRDFEELARLTLYAVVALGAGAPVDQHKELLKASLQAFSIESFDREDIQCSDRLFECIHDSALVIKRMSEVAGKSIWDEGDLSVLNRLTLLGLGAIDRNLAVLAGTSTGSVLSFKEYAHEYIAAVKFRHRMLTPPQTDASRKVPIEDLHVFPGLSSGTEDSDRPVSLDDLGTEGRFVILGDPGGGKSTLSVRRAVQIASSDQDVWPFYIILRDYEQQKAANGCSIVEFIERLVSSTYQLPAPPKGFVEYACLNGHAAVLFDGLDELLDTRARVDIADDIETFANRYPTAGIVATSRRVGYAEAPLDESLFNEISIDPFDDPRVEEYAHKWFGSDPDLPNAHELALAFLRDSSAVADLRANPLMLALMCSLYKSERYIPRNRPEVYEKCSLMMFERWDSSRGIARELPFQAHVRPAMQFLAFRLFTGVDDGLCKRDLEMATTEYLFPRVYADRESAVHAAEAFVDFCTGRAWVFSDVGIDVDTSEPIFQFTHRTFLEYFAAKHLVRTKQTPHDLLEELLPRIANAEWEVVAQLSVQIQSSNLEGAGDALIDGILQTITPNDSSGSSDNLAAFCVRLLDFVVPSPAVLESLVGCIFGQLLRWPDAETDRVRGLNTARELANVHGENLTRLVDAFVRVFDGIAASDRAAAPSQLLLMLDFAASQVAVSGASRDAREVSAWARALDAVVRGRADILEAALSSPGFAGLLRRAGIVDFELVVSRFGLIAGVVPARSATMQWWIMSTIGSFTAGDDASDFGRSKVDLEVLGAYMHTSRSWFEPYDARYGESYSMLGVRTIAMREGFEEELSEAQLSAFYALVLQLVEVMLWNGDGHRVEGAIDLSAVPAPLASAIQARASGRSPQESYLPGLLDDQQALHRVLTRWASPDGEQRSELSDESSPDQG